MNPDYDTDSDPLLASLDAMAEEESSDDSASEPDYFEASARDMFDALKEDDFETFLDALSELIER